MWMFVLSPQLQLTGQRTITALDRSMFLEVKVKGLAERCSNRKKQGGKWASALWLPATCSSYHAIFPSFELNLPCHITAFTFQNIHFGIWHFQIEISILGRHEEKEREII